MNNLESPFESRDLTSSYVMDLVDNSLANGKHQYRGGERRYHSRRTIRDRRSEVRFEIDKVDRRESHGRRWDDGVDLSR